MDTPISPSVQGFWEKVYDAHQASEDVDGFDVDSNDPASSDEFVALQDNERTNATALVRYIMAHANELMIALNA